VPVNARLTGGIAVAFLLLAAGWFAWRSPDPAEPDAVAEIVPAKTIAAESSTNGLPRMHQPGPGPDAAPATAPPAVGTFEPANDPDGDAKLLAHFQALVPRIYEDARAELGLDESQTEILFALLVDQQMRRVAQPLIESPGGAEAYNALLAQFERELEDQLGGDRARKFANYRRTENARYEVEDLRRDLESISLPLSETQRKAMIRAAIERGAYVVQPTVTGNELDQAVLQEAYARFEQRDQKLLSIAHGILGPEQVAIVERVVTNRQRTYEEMLRNTVRLNSP
jgi:hypothetical protein